MRVCFTLQVRESHLAQYSQVHEAVWPEMLEALDAAGWRRYSIFLGEHGLVVGTFECDSLAGALGAMAGTEVNARWQRTMAPFFEGTDGRPADEAFTVLPEIFNLADQLARTRAVGSATTATVRS